MERIRAGQGWGVGCPFTRFMACAAFAGHRTRETSIPCVSLDSCNPIIKFFSRGTRRNGGFFRSHRYYSPWRENERKLFKFLIKHIRRANLLRRYMVSRKIGERIKSFVFDSWLRSDLSRQEVSCKKLYTKRPRVLCCRLFGSSLPPPPPISWDRQALPATESSGVWIIARKLVNNLNFQ